MKTQRRWTWSAIWLFFRRALAHPAKSGAVIPSSDSLGRLIAEQMSPAEHEVVVELGAGTGAVTRAILSSGVPADRLIVVENDEEMTQFLRTEYPDVTVVEADAAKIRKLLPASVDGSVGAVVCGIPVSLLPLDRQRELASAMLSLMPPGHRFLVYTYRLRSPLSAREIGLVGTRLGFTWRNLPPASVWAYSADGPNGSR